MFVDILEFVIPASSVSLCPRGGRHDLCFMYATICYTHVTSFMCHSFLFFLLLKQMRCANNYEQILDARVTRRDGSSGTPAALPTWFDTLPFCLPRTTIMSAIRKVLLEKVWLLSVTPLRLMPLKCPRGRRDENGIGCHGREESDRQGRSQSSRTKCQAFKTTTRYTSLLNTNKLEFLTKHDHLGCLVSLIFE